VPAISVLLSIFVGVIRPSLYSAPDGDGES
jgi:hypothetical protein